MRIIAPAANARFSIAADGTAPTLVAQTDGEGPHEWSWSLAWLSFRRSGRVQTADNRLDFAPLITNLGGRLEITARTVPAAPTFRPGAPPSGQRPAGIAAAAVRVRIIGENPTPQQVSDYLATKPNSDGFGAIIAHEAHSRHFTAAGEPIKSFDNGYGMCQLTSPAPTFEQCWSWKLNVDAGLALFAQKRAAAVRHLSQSNRTYSASQLRYEAVARWNGGPYHTWDGRAWARNPDVLCDAATGNIGWDMTLPANAGQTARQLHDRDTGSYRRGRRDGDPWRYSGVCYADAILG